jgi:Protein of unknown function (DUF1236)
MWFVTFVEYGGLFAKIAEIVELRLSASVVRTIVISLPINKSEFSMKNFKNTLLMSAATAAALIVGVGIAFAQAPAAQAPAAQQGAPAEKMAPAQGPKAVSKDEAPVAGTKSGKTEKKAEKKIDGNGGTIQRADGNTKHEKKSKGMSSETSSSNQSSSEIKPDAKTKAEVKTGTKSPKKTGNAQAETTGQGAASGSKNLSIEQRTAIRTVVKRRNVQPMTNVKFSVSVGTYVPRAVHYYPLPVEIVHIYPGWRGYDYFLVGDQIIVVNPRTHRIVAVLEA